MRQDPPCVGDSLKGIGVSVVFFRFAVRFCSISGGSLSLKRIVLAPNEARVARLGRYFLPDQPLHVIQRDNNRQPPPACMACRSGGGPSLRPLWAESQIAPATVNGSPAQARPPLLFELRRCATAELAAAVRGILCQCQYLQWATGAATSRRRLSAKYTFATKMGHSRSAITTGKALWSQARPRPQAGERVPIAGGINGGFYGPMAAETGGNFNFHTTAGPTYLTSGIFAAKR